VTKIPTGGTTAQTTSNETRALPADDLQHGRTASKPQKSVRLKLPVVYMSTVKGGIRH